LTKAVEEAKTRTKHKFNRHGTDWESIVDQCRQFCLTLKQFHKTWKAREEAERKKLDLVASGISFYYQFTLRPQAQALLNELEKAKVHILLYQQLISIELQLRGQDDIEFVKSRLQFMHQSSQPNDSAPDKNQSNLDVCPSTQEQSDHDKFQVTISSLLAALSNSRIVKGKLHRRSKRIPIKTNPETIKEQNPEQAQGLGTPAQALEEVIPRIVTSDANSLFSASSSKESMTDGLVETLPRIIPVTSHQSVSCESGDVILYQIDTNTWSGEISKIIHASEWTRLVDEGRDLAQNINTAIGRTSTEDLVQVDSILDSTDTQEPKNKTRCNTDPGDPITISSSNDDPDALKPMAKIQNSETILGSAIRESREIALSLKDNDHPANSDIKNTLAEADETSKLQEKSESQQMHTESSSGKYVGKLVEPLDGDTSEKEQNAANELHRSITKSLSSRSTDTGDVLQDPKTDSILEDNQDEAVDSSSRPGDLLQTFERMFSRSHCRMSSHEAQFNVGQDFIADGTWMSIATFNDTPWDFLFFQKPDHWIQLALMPKDCHRKLILLDCIVQAAKNSPLISAIQRKDHRRVILRLFFLPMDNENRSALKEGTLDFSEGPPFYWSFKNIELPPTASPIIQVGLPTDFDESMQFLTCVSSSESLISLYEGPDGNWRIVPYPNDIPISPGDYIYHTQIPNEAKIRVRKLRHDSIIQYQFQGLCDWTELLSSSPTKIDINHQDIDWHGHTPSQSWDSCQMQIVSDRDASAAGIVCKTIEDKIYLFQGHPWWDKFPRPEFICTVKSGSNFFVSQKSRSLLYISPENEMRKIEFTVKDVGSITFGTPCSVFSTGYFLTNLNDLSLPGPMETYILSEGQSNKPISVTLSSSNSSTTGSNATSNVSSDRDTRSLGGND